MMITPNMSSAARMNSANKRQNLSFGDVKEIKKGKYYQVIDKNKGVPVYDVKKGKNDLSIVPFGTEGDKESLIAASVFAKEACPQDFETPRSAAEKLDQIHHDPESVLDGL